MRIYTPISTRWLMCGAHIYMCIRARIILPSQGLFAGADSLAASRLTSMLLGGSFVMRLNLTPILACLLTVNSWAADPKLEPIFNAKDLAGWNSPQKEAFWRVENGVLIGESDAKLGENYLWSEKSYGDFVLEFDVRWSGEIDSGVEIRQPKMQLQLGVSRSLKKDMTGSFYVGKPGYPEAGQAKTAAQLMHPDGEWNTFRLEARGTTFTVWINGQPASHYTDEKFSGAAPLGLQIHGGVKMKVEYRNIRAAAL